MQLRLTDARHEFLYRRTRLLHRDDELYGCGNPRLVITDSPEFMQLMRDAEKPSEDRKHALQCEPVEWDEKSDTITRDNGQRLIGGGVVLKDIPGAGRVYDWRDSSWTPASGGRIDPLVFVQHIPVVPNVPGIADFITLRNVLVAQGLMVQSATDRDGNVALFTPFNVLCYQARGANSFSCGTEHMHNSIDEHWTERQFRASAWLVNQALNKHGIPAYRGDLRPGNGVVRVSEHGQVTHRDVADKAGFHDRTDPGPGYSIGHVRDLVIYYRQHATFEHAPTLKAA